MATKYVSQQIGFLLRQLAELGLADKTLVFGSVMKGNPDADDLDCLIDLDFPLFTGSVHPPKNDTSGLSRLPESISQSLHMLLALCRHSHLQGAKGPLLNCFLRQNGRILAPNKNATWWVPSSEALSVWDKALSRGRPVSQITWPPVQVPVV